MRLEVVNKTKTREKQRDTQDVNKPNFQPGCATLLWTAFENNLIYVAFVGIIILFVEILAMIFSCIIIGAVREKRAQA